MLQASDGERTVIMKPAEVSAFIHTHRKHSWVGHNVAFDFWVLHQYLTDTYQFEAVTDLWSMVDSGQVHDTQYLDMLIRLAKGTDTPTESPDLQPRNLAQVAKQYINLDLDKEDPHRLRFGEIDGLDWNTLDPAWFDYAARDALAVVLAWITMTETVDTLTNGGGVGDRAYGYLTEQIQTKASIALADIGRRGVAVDTTKVHDAKVQLKAEMEAHVEVMAAHVPGLFKVYKDKGRKGTYKMTESGLPQMYQAPMVDLLTKTEQDLDITAPRSEKKGQISLSAAWWGEQQGLPEPVDAWVKLQAGVKTLQFLDQLEGHDRVYTGYRTLVRTGRTSAHDPNIQQMPRKPWFRSLFVAPPGKYLAAIDYSAIELRTLARICEVKFGSSKLGEAIRRGIDPHAYTAAMVTGMELDQFMDLKKTDPTFFKKSRQQAKAINFGVPGGLGPYKLTKYAWSNYQVDMSLAEARQLRKQLIYDIYPEIGQYLNYDAVANLVVTTGLPEAQIRYILSDSMMPMAAYARNLERVARGMSASLSSMLVSQSWDTLDKLTVNMSSQIRELVARREGSMWLAMKIFSPGVWTITGRFRGDVTFTESRNTPFQGLAADGAKLALWNLIREGYQVVAFVHDEVVLEVDNLVEAQAAGGVMVAAMSQILDGFPIQVEISMEKQWSKP